MPQLDLISFPSVAISLAIGFITTVYILSVYSYPKIGLILKFRDKIVGEKASEKVTAKSNSVLDSSAIDLVKKIKE